MNLTVTLRNPHEYQTQFLASTAKRKVIRAGRRSGKTVGVAELSIKAFLAGHRVLYATPTSDQLDAFWFEIVKALAEPIDQGIFYKNESRHIIELPRTQQRLRGKTAWNADTLRGDYADTLILDEYQLMAEDAWGVVGAPMLMDNNGDAVFIYTPPSYRSSGVSKAKDKQHAAKMFKRASVDDSGRWEAFHFTSMDNPYIDQGAVEDLAQDMTRLAYRQEILAEDIDDAPGALWTRAILDEGRVLRSPDLARIVVAIDPAVSATATSNQHGIIVAGIEAGSKPDGYTLEDATLDGTPAEWARAAITAYYRWEANYIVAEANQGGDMVRHTLETIDPTVPVRLVHASRGKQARAEPVSALYEKGRIHHVGTFPELEDQLCVWVPGEGSPDRLDALVWAYSEMMVTPTRLTRAGIRPGAANLYGSREKSLPGRNGRSTGKKGRTHGARSKYS